MGLDQHFVDRLPTLVRESCPGRESFADERTVKEGREHELEAVQKAIGRDDLRFCAQVFS